MSLLDSNISILILSDGPDSDMPSNVITLIPLIWQHCDFPEKGAVCRVIFYLAVRWSEFPEEKIGKGFKETPKTPPPKQKVANLFICFGFQHVSCGIKQDHSHWK